MRRFLTSTALVLGGLGCAAICSAESCPEEKAAAQARAVEASCEVLGKPRLLVERAEAALKAQKLETAYQYFALLHTLHPDSPEDRKQFRLAARVFVESYFRHRIEFESAWVKTEPTFMFDWLETFFQGAEQFPQPQVEAMFIGMHYGMFRDFLAYASSHPDIVAWTITATKDNGIIESIRGTRTVQGATPTGQAPGG